MRHHIRVLVAWCVFQMVAMAATPTITSVVSNAGSTGGGTVVTITGTNLSSPTGVTFGGTAGTNISGTGGTQVVVTTPAHVAGAVNVVVTTAGGSGTKTSAFTYVTPYAPVFASWPSSTAQVDGAVPAFSTGQSEALAVVGKVYTYYVVISGSPAPTTASLSLTTKPAGMIWTEDTTNTVGCSLMGTITWTPTVAGVNPVTISVTTSQGTVTQSWNVRAIAAPTSASIDGKNAQNAGQPIKIMCMGDSITEGTVQHVSSYRSTMFRTLASANFAVSAVGGSTQMSHADPTDILYVNHEGHAGWKAYTYGGGTAPGYHSLVSIVDGTLGGTWNGTTDNDGCLSNTVITSYAPDVVILMAGTNDIQQGPYNGTNVHIIEAPNLDDRATDHMSRLINAIWSANPATRIIVLPTLHNAAVCTQPISATNNVINTPADQDTWNIGTGISVNSTLVARTQTGTANLVTTYQRANKPITFVDANRMAMYPAGWDPTGVSGSPNGMSGDGAGVHPGAAAYRNAIAQASFRAVLDVTPGALDTTVPPSPPSGMIATINGANIDVVWTRNSLNEQYFDVDWSTNANFSGATTTQVPAGNTATSLTGFPTNALMIYLRVRARNAGGSSWYCPPIQMRISTHVTTGMTLELNVLSGVLNDNAAADVTFSGGGTLLKTGAGTIVWGVNSATFQMDSGALIDVEGGTFVGGSNANEVWTNNLSNLNVASGATFDGAEANVRVNALTGGGTIKSGYNGAGYTNFTFGVDNGSGTFSGVLANSSVAGNFVKAGTGTQILSGPNTYTGSTTIRNGTIIAANNSTFGTGTVNMVDSQSGNGDNVSLLTSGAVTITNPLIANTESDQSGVITIGGTTADSSVFSGSLQMDKDVTMTAVAGGTVTFSGAISRASSDGASITKTGAGTVILANQDTCTGSITINAGTLTLGVAGSINKASSISIAAGATFDVSAITSYVLPVSTTLNASGSGTGAQAAILKGSSTSVSLGSQPIKLSFTPTAFTGDTTHPALYLPSGALILSNNAFTITNEASTPLGAGTYRVIETVGGVSGVLTGSTVLVNGAGLAAGTSARMSISGTSSQYVNLVVSNLLPVISTSSLANGIVGTPYIQTLSATNSPTSWTVTGSLPPGLSWTAPTTNGVANNCVISGTPTTASANAYTFTVAAINGIGQGTKTLSITIDTAPQVITGFNALPAKTYGNAPFTINGVTGGSSGNPVVFTSGDQTIATIDNTNGVSTVTIVGAGSVTITASQAGNPNYSAAPPQAQTLTISKASLTVKANTANRAYGAPNPAFTGTLTGVVSGDGITDTYTSTANNTTPAGVYDPVIFTQSTLPITPGLLDPNGRLGNYTVTYTKATLTITQATQIINNFQAIGTQTYGVAPITLSATFSSGLTPVFSVISGPATVSGNTLTITGAGSVVIAANQAGNGNYSAAPVAKQTVTVNKAALTITATDTSIVYGTVSPTFAGTLTGVVSGDSITGTYSSTTNSTTAVGIYPQAITPTLVDTNTRLGNYTVTIVKGTVTITALNQTPQNITGFAATATKTYGDAPFTISGVTGGASGKPVVFTSNNAAVATVSGTTVTIVGAGSAVITANQAGDATYASASAQAQTLTVNPAVLTVAATDTSRVFGTANPTFTGILTGVVSGDVITASYNSPAVGINAPVGAYPQAIIPTLVDSGNRLGNYTVTITNGTLTITQASQAISNFNALPAKTYGNAPFTITGVTGGASGQPITFSSNNPAVATVSGTTVTITGAGSAMITANQGGTTNYATATSASQTLTIAKATLTAVANSASRTFGSNNPGFTGTLSGVVAGDGITATYFSSATPTTPIGTYGLNAAEAITPKLADPNGRLGNYTVNLTNGTLTITVAPLVAPVITSASTVSATVGQVFSFQITASNNPTLFTVSKLPVGLSINIDTGAITGTPLTPSVSVITVSASNAAGSNTATLTLTVNPPSPVITSAAIVSGMVGTAFTYQVTATNSPASYGAAGLPSGLSINSTSGAITGIPTAAGLFSVTLTATNASGTGSATQSLIINPEPGLSPVVSAATSGSGGGGCGAGAVIGLLGLALMGFGTRMRRSR